MIPFASILPVNVEMPDTLKLPCSFVLPTTFNFAAGIEVPMPTEPP